jgi:acid phosphatase family membrane protein YuiD
MLRFKEKRWDSKRMLDSGGMPSSHSATVTALAVAIGLQEGTGSPAFAIIVVLACVVSLFFHPLVFARLYYTYSRCGGVG